MTALLDKAIAMVRTLPASAQDDLASMLLAYAEGTDEPVRLTPSEAAEIAEAEVEASHGDFASQAEMRALWAKYGA